MTLDPAPIVPTIIHVPALTTLPSTGSVHAHTIDAARCRASGAGLTSASTDGSENQVMVALVDQHGATIAHPTTAPQLTITNCADADITVTRNTNGEYIFVYKLARAGDHQVCVMYGGVHIAGSPFPALTFGPVVPRRTLNYNGAGSEILDDASGAVVGGMLPLTLRTLTLLLRCHSGTDRSVFQRAVVGKRNILVVIRNTAGYVFGGFVSSSFDSFPGDALWKSADEDVGSYVFSLRTRFGTPVKLISIAKHKSSGVYFWLHAGFVMGCGDVRTFASSSQCKPYTYTVVAPGYASVVVDSILLAGSKVWTPQCIEVYHCT